MSETKSPLELQIEQERRELDAVPKIPLTAFLGGPAVRCHICGQVFRESELEIFDGHVRHAAKRKACPNCHPERTT